MMDRGRWKKRAQPSHADDWLMTYADMITLLLCFFAIYLIVSVPQKYAAKHPDPQPVVELKPPPLPQTWQPVVDIAAIAPPKENRSVFQGSLPFYDADEEKESDKERRPDAVTPAPVQEPAPQASSEYEKRGDRIVTFEESNATFFDRGSAVLSGTGKAVLLGIAGNIMSDKFKDYQITVEGHTDDTPIRTAEFPSNWELSTARAASVVRFFLEQGVPAARLRAAGYADTFSKAPNRDEKGNPLPVNQAQNRRVVIKLEKIEKNEENPSLR